MNTETRDQVMRETLKHVRRVGELIAAAIYALSCRAFAHDKSKFDPEEFDSFVEATPTLKGSTFGSDEYKAALDKIRPAIDHHSANNRHHPEYHDNGVTDMTLIDLVEMVCDWKAASERHDNANFSKSIKHCVERFGIDPQLASIIENTSRKFGWL